MKKFLIASALAALAVTAMASAAAAQQSSAPGGPGNGGGSTPGGEGGRPTYCYPGSNAPGCAKAPKIALGEGCGCTVKKVRIGGRISYVQDCYFFDVKANLERYCQPWERVRSN